tara:strand:- start:1923 stop:2189 length:267 start_codon:yes stop_codon:yes gene_type:complete
MSKKQLNKRGKWEIVLQNSNTISFDHVITCLVEICGHNEFQANQCALLTDKTGACSIFIDKHTNCEYVYELLIKSGLQAKIQKYKNNV